MPVRELTTEDDLRKAFPVMRELRPHLDESTYLGPLRTMRDEGYRLFALVDNDEIVALAGITEGTNLYYGKYMWVYDLITSESTRSRGHGRELLSHIEDLARELKLSSHRPQQRIVSKRRAPFL